MRTLAVVTVLLMPFALLAGTNQWTNIGPDAGHVFALVLDPKNSLTLYASTNTGLFKTRDGGASWSTLADAANEGVERQRGPDVPMLQRSDRRRHEIRRRVHDEGDLGRLRLHRGHRTHVQQA